MSFIPRKDQHLQELIDLLDSRLLQAQGDLRVAYASLTKEELEAVDKEIERCLDFRYYAENYHVIPTEGHGLRTLYPFWDSQEIFYEKILELQRANVPVKLIVLKARQLGQSTASEALIFHKTLVSEACNALVVAQDPRQADYLFGMARRAYDKLPWWLRPESRYEAKGKYLTFDRNDETERVTRPGLGSEIRVEAANRLTGVGVGMTQHACHMCLSDKNQVISADGFLKSIADVQVGDKLWANPSMVAVSGKSSRLVGEQETGYAVVPYGNKHFPIEGTGNHRVLAGTLFQEKPADEWVSQVSNIRWYELSELKENNCLIYPVKPITSNRKVPEPSAKFDLPYRSWTRIRRHIKPQNNREWGFVAGLYLAEGTYDAKAGSVCLALNLRERGLAERFSRCTDIPLSVLIHSNNGMVVRFYSAQLGRWLENNFGRKDQKTIPDWCWNVGREFLLGVVEGLILGDACVLKSLGKIIFVSKRVHLALRLREVVLSLGCGYASIMCAMNTAKGKGTRKFPSWRVEYSGEPSNALRKLLGLPTYEIKVRTTNRHKFGYIDRERIWIAIREVERVNLDQVYDIEVDSIKHEFLLPAAVTHNSEMSLWPGDAILAEQLFPTFNATNGLYIMESTARGRKDFFHRFWVGSVEGKTRWTPVFIEAFRVKKYSKPIPEGVKFEHTTQERAIYEKVKERTGVELSNEYLNWRRETIAEYIALQGDESKFYQEFAQTHWSEAFQGSGVCAFNKRRLHEILETDCCNPLWYGEINLDENHVPHPRLHPCDKGETPPVPEEYGARLYVWEQPSPEETYFIGVDVAHGIKGHDFSVAEVIRIGRKQQPDVQVAEWHGWINAQPFGHVVAALGYWYNTAQIAVECNDIGLTTNNELMRVIEYPNIFRWKHYDKVKNFISDFTGWFTNVKTRDQIIDKLRMFMDDRAITLRSETLIDECFDFTQQEQGGKFRGWGTNDDRVMAIQIAVFCAHDSEWGIAASLQPRGPKAELEDAKAQHTRLTGHQEFREPGGVVICMTCGAKIYTVQDFVNTDFSLSEGARQVRHVLGEREVPKEVLMYQESEESERWKLF